jgi:hypothetical protein
VPPEVRDESRSPIESQRFSHDGETPKSFAVGPSSIRVLVYPDRVLANFVETTSAWCVLAAPPHLDADHGVTYRCSTP